MSPRILLLCLLSIGSVVIGVTEGKYIAYSEAESDPEVSTTYNEQHLSIDFKKAFDLVSQLDNQEDDKKVVDKDDKTTVDKDDKKDDEPSDSWICPNLTKDLEQNWNLTVRVSERAVVVLMNVGSVLYDLINCQGTLLLPVPVKCIFNNLVRVKDIIDPAIDETVGFIKEGYPLIRETITDTRQCYSF